MKKRQPTLANQAEEKITLKDYLDTDLYAKLRAKKKRP